MAGFYFDTKTDVPEGASTGLMEPVPQGIYKVEIERAELCATKAGNGQYIKIMVSITSESHTNRKIFQNFNIQNQNAQAETIGRAQFAELLTAIGKQKIEDTDQLVGHECLAKLSIRPAQGNYDAQNEVKKWMPVAAPKAVQPAAKAPATFPDIPF